VIKRGRVFWDEDGRAAKVELSASLAAFFDRMILGTAGGGSWIMD
jgi:hypothetical protein